MQAHKQAVERIASAVRQFYHRKEPFRINHGSTNSTRQTNKHAKTVDIGMLRNVLTIDREKRTALVEPNVPMDRLVEETLKEGLVPGVVMEFPGITAGGGFAGTGGESSSFKHGYFNKTVNSAEIILGNGDVVTASATENPDLFYGASGAVGTLGITTLLELQLQEAKNFVKTTYHPVRSVSEAIKFVHEATKDSSLDYVDGVLFSHTHGAIVTGKLTDEPPTNNGAIQTFSRPSDPWFYMHVQRVTADTSEPVTEHVPLAEYLFRYDRGGFWVGRSAFSYMAFPFTWLTRWFLDEFLHTRMLYRALHASGQSKSYVVQDLALPYSTVEDFIGHCNGKDGAKGQFDIWPLWLCPLKQGELKTMHPHSAEKGNDGKTVDQLLNVGLWGFGSKDPDEFVRKNVQLERKLKELG
ncbi:hypothetical protein LTS18_003499, partial [Coniosporium uncinatum]